MRLFLLFALFLSGCAVQIFPRTAEQSVPLEAEQGVLRAEPIGPQTQEEKAAFLSNRWCLAPVVQATVVNPNPVLMRDEKAQALRKVTKDPQSIRFGESCLTESTALLEAVGMLSEHEIDRVLILYWGPDQRKEITACPSGVLFFQDFADFWRHCQASHIPPEEVLTIGKKKRAQTIHDMWEAQEKLKVQTILDEKATQN